MASNNCSQLIQSRGIYSSKNCEKYIAPILQILGQLNVISMPNKYMASNNCSQLIQGRGIYSLNCEKIYSPDFANFGPIKCYKYAWKIYGLK